MVVAAAAATATAAMATAAVAIQIGRITDLTPSQSEASETVGTGDGTGVVGTGEGSTVGDLDGKILTVGTGVAVG